MAAARRQAVRAGPAGEMPCAATASPAISSSKARSSPPTAHQEHRSAGDRSDGERPAAAAGNFGVSTSFTLRTFSAEPVTVFALTWTAETRNPDKVALALIAALENAPPELGLGDAHVARGAAAGRPGAAPQRDDRSHRPTVRERQALDDLLAPVCVIAKPQQAMVWGDAPYWAAQRCSRRPIPLYFQFLTGLWPTRPA